MCDVFFYPLASEFRTINCVVVNTRPDRCGFATCPNVCISPGVAWKPSHAVLLQASLFRQHPQERKHSPPSEHQTKKPKWGFYGRSVGARGGGGEHVLGVTTSEILSETNAKENIFVESSYHTNTLWCHKHPSCLQQGATAPEPLWALRPACLSTAVWI